MASRHVEDSFCIIEEGLLPKCSRCGLHGRGSNSLKHQTTASCIDHALKRERLAKLRQQQSDVAGGTNDIEFTVGGVPIEQVAQFRYLGRMMDEHDDDSHAMGRQLSRARTKWSRFAAVLHADGVKPKVMAYFYKAVVQAVLLLYGSETWYCQSLLGPTNGAVLQQSSMLMGSNPKSWHISTRQLFRLYFCMALKLGIVRVLFAVDTFLPQQGGPLSY